jgi:hypothetical protein
MEAVASNGIGDKKQTKTVTLEEQFDVVWRYECNEHVVDIVSAMGPLESTCKSIRKLADK